MSQNSTQANRIITLTLEPNDPMRLANLCGQRDEHLKLVESRLGVTLRNRGNTFQLAGPSPRVKAAANVIEHLYREAEASELSPDTVHLFLQESGLEALEEDEGTGDEGEVLLRTPKALIKPRGFNQQSYVQSIRAHDINFGIGPAGTGKTYLAVAAAVEALNQQEVRRILLVRPAVEAGEKLGFLPGDLAQKIDPYLRPLYDALYEMIGFEQVGKLIERQIIEIAPLAYMRGRTLNNSFIILDESQNTTREQMKMFLTRIGFGSTAVITGDITQVDLPRGQNSGLIQVLEVLKDTPGIGVTHFAAKDVVRHPLVQRIIEAYDHFEAQEEAAERARKQEREQLRREQLSRQQANGNDQKQDQDGGPKSGQESSS
ncbi:phosphate starvation protein PhoH [Litchfieldella anticariensis FP35 = DSM 16096]|uniref:PhoH-like protein n=1 Tax=Litchfieldella anticariensis (strain DSM 16096 / CECT 5854 / CIP 108499 / LMG 22089 / FP35) TaxID=1121939 RepID=S2KZW4_LITA3|nr:PhoH family protein [Halomonas anticariensis]EPC00929.1 phosphate starvation protein PhoH [Halomonas anticariensis FP35 = DSM 16096]